MDEWAREQAEKAARALARMPAWQRKVAGLDMPLRYSTPEERIAELAAQLAEAQDELLVCHRLLNDAAVEHSGRTLPQRVTELIRSYNRSQHALRLMVVQRNDQADQLVEAREVLRRLEWFDRLLDFPRCPVCKATNTYKHVPDCALAAALGVDAGAE